MPVLPIRTIPDPMLRQRSKKVPGGTPALRKLIDDMLETMYEQGGVGLAAPQVGVLQRVIVIHLPEEDEPRIFINPEIIRREGEREVEEGCLSIPGYRGMVRRSERVRAKGLDGKGRQVRVRAEELLAQALEHEIDHLNGVLYIDHLISPDSFWELEEEPAGSASGYSG